jgi:arginine N-succinyltransferase
MMRVRPGLAQDAAAVAALTTRGPRTPADASDHLLVVEDLRQGRIVGTVRLRAAVGLHLPRYAYHVGCTVHAARELQLFHRQRTLYLSNDHTGASELCDVAVEGAPLALADQAAALSLAVQAAMLCIAEQRARFAAQLIVVLPGVHDGAGQSPFWTGLGRHFYTGDPAEAARQHGLAWKSHVAALMPRHPLYCSFLSEAAQAAIAQADPGSQLLRQVLEHEGLRYGHHIDIADGGPILEAAVDDLRSVSASRRWQVAAQPASGALRSHVVLNPSTLQAARVRVAMQGERLLFTPADAQALGLAVGQWVRAVPLC